MNIKQWDEVHAVKARNGKLNNNIAQVITGKPTVFLTGTPIMSKPEDIFGILQIADPTYFGDWKKFSKKFIQFDHGGRYGTRVVGGRNLDELRGLVQDIIIRRTEYEVSIQLPKTVMNTIECDMDSTQEKILSLITETQDMITSEMDMLKVNGVIPDFNQAKADRLDGQSKALIAARQAASTDPRLFNMSSSKMMREKYGSLIPASYKMSHKSESLLELLEDLTDDGDKVILFTKFRTSAVLAAQDISKVLKQNVLLYTGEENDNVRDKVIHDFKNTCTHNILIGTEAMAEGWM